MNGVSRRNFARLFSVAAAEYHARAVADVSAPAHERKLVDFRGKLYLAPYITSTTIMKKMLSTPLAYCNALLHNPEVKVK